jgi:hypothetical protein
MLTKTSRVALLATLTLVPASVAAAAPVDSISGGFETDLSPFTGHIQVGVAGDSAWKRNAGPAHSGSAAALAPQANHVTDNWLTSIDSLHVPAGNATAKLSFYHSFNFEASFDGGLVEYSLDGGAFADVPPGAYLAGAPNGTISSNFGSPIAGHSAWTASSGPGSPAPFVHTLIDLSGWAGHDVTIRFRQGTDASSASPSGWLVDDVDAELGPTASTGDATAVGDSAATVAGTVSPHGTATSFHIEYGPTAGYGAVAPAADAAVGSDDGPDPVSQPLSGLGASTTYHYRVVATYAGGSVAGIDKTFTTAAAQPAPVPPETPAPPPPPPGRPAFAGLVLKAQTVKPDARGRVRLTLTCPADADGACAGTDKLVSARKLRLRRSGKLRRRTLGTVQVSIAAGQTKRVRVRLTRATRSLLAAKRSLRTSEVATAHDARGLAKTTSAKVQLRARRRR